MTCLETYGEARDRMIRERAWRRSTALGFLFAMLLAAAGLCVIGG